MPKSPSKPVSSKKKTTIPPAESASANPPARRALDQSLTKLSSADIIRRLTEELDPTYIFKHQLVQETAYDTMLKTKRAELHRLVAETIEQLSPDQLEENAAVLAFHYQRGGWDDMAFVYAALAGDVAWRGYAHTEALTHYDFAVEIAGRLDTVLFNPRIREVYTKRGRIFEVLGESADAIQNYRAMIAFAQRVQDPLMEAEGLNHLVTIQSMGTGSSAVEAIQKLARALELARQADDQALIGRTLWNMGLIRRFSEPARAMEFFQQSLELARAAHLGELAGYALTELTVQMQMAGRMQMAHDYSNQALEEFRAIDNQPMIVDALANRAITSYFMGEMELARESGEEGVRISQATENLWGTLFNQITLLDIITDEGDFQRILVEGEEYLKLTRKTGFPPFIGFALGILVRINFELGQFDRAQRFAEECVQILDQMNAPLWSEVGRNIQAQLFVRIGRLDDAHAILDSVWFEGKDPGNNLFSNQTAGSAIAEMALIEGRLDFGISFCNWFLGYCTSENAWRIACDVFYYRGLLHHARGDSRSAERDLNRAREIAEHSAYNLLLWRIDAALAHIYAQRDDMQRAQQTRQRAADLIRTLAKSISDPTLRNAFTRRNEIAELFSTLDQSQ